MSRSPYVDFASARPHAIWGIVLVVAGACGSSRELPAAGAGQTEAQEEGDAVATGQAANRDEGPEPSVLDPAGAPEIAERIPLQLLEKDERSELFVRLGASGHDLNWTP